MLLKKFGAILVRNFIHFFEVLSPIFGHGFWVSKIKGRLPCSMFLRVFVKREELEVA